MSLLLVVISLAHTRYKNVTTLWLLLQIDYSFIIFNMGLWPLSLLYICVGVHWYSIQACSQFRHSSSGGLVLAVFSLLLHSCSNIFWKAFSQFFILPSILEVCCP